MEEITKSGLTFHQARKQADSYMKDIKNGFVGVGYALKAIRDEQLWKDGFGSFDEFMAANYEKDKAWASRCISLYEKFGAPVQLGDTARLKKQYQGYNVSQLIEMISLPEDKRLEVSPDMTVREIRELKPKREKVATVATPEPVAAEVDPVTRDMYMDALARHLLTMHWDWFREDNMHRVLNVETSPKEINNKFGMGTAISFSMKGCDSAKASLFEHFVQVENSDEWIGEFRWFYLARAVQVMYGRMAMEKTEEEVQRSRQEQQDICNRAPRHSCTLTTAQRKTVGNGFNCGKSCCWECQYHDTCNLECNASAGRDGAIPVYDAAWFVRKWAELMPDDLHRVMQICRSVNKMSEIAKTVQEELSPDGSYSACWSIYYISFLCFSNGIELRFGKEEMQLKYGRFVKELLAIYDPQDLRFDEEKKDIVPELQDSVPDNQDSVSIEPVAVSEPEPESDMPCDNCIHDDQGCCDYPDTPTDYCVLGDKREPKSDEPAEQLEVAIETEVIEPLTYSDQDINEEIRFLEKNIALAESDAGLKTTQAYLKLKIRYDSTLLLQEARKQQQVVQEPEIIQVQPELPVLKNNDQRKAWLKDYTAWGLWYYDEHIDVSYYKYDFEDGSRLIAAEYLQREVEWGNEKYDQVFYHLLEKARHKYRSEQTYEDKFRYSSTSESVIVEFVKNIQKGGKR